MKRRSFLHIAGATITAHAGYDLLGGPETCEIELTYDGEPVTKRVETDFYLNSTMSVVFVVERRLLCNGVAMWKHGDPDPFLRHEFDLIDVTPNIQMQIEWKVNT